MAALPPMLPACVIDLSKQRIRSNVGCSHVDCGVPADGAAGEQVCDRETEIAAGRNVICGDVHRGVGADRSYPAPVAVVDLKGRVAAGSEIAREIEVEAGAPADGASAVEDLGIKSADR